MNRSGSEAQTLRCLCHEPFQPGTQPLEPTPLQGHRAAALADWCGRRAAQGAAVMSLSRPVRTRLTAPPPAPSHSLPPILRQALPRFRAVTPLPPQRRDARHRPLQRQNCRPSLRHESPVRFRCSGRIYGELFGFKAAIADCPRDSRSHSNGLAGRFPARSNREWSEADREKTCRELPRQVGSLVHASREASSRSMGPDSRASMRATRLGGSEVQVRPSIAAPTICWGVRKWSSTSGVTGLRVPPTTTPTSAPRYLTSGSAGWPRATGRAIRYSMRST